MSLEPTHYEVLGVPRGAPIEVIKKVYRGLAKTLHEDRAGADYDHARWSHIAKAYECLIDPEKRDSYELYLNDLEAEDDDFWLEPGAPPPVFDAEVEKRKIVQRYQDRADEIRRRFAQLRNREQAHFSQLLVQARNLSAPLPSAAAVDPVAAQAALDAAFEEADTEYERKRVKAKRKLDDGKIDKLEWLARISAAAKRNVDTKAELEAQMAAALQAVELHVAETRRLREEADRRIRADYAALMQRLQSSEDAELQQAANVRDTALVQVGRP